MKILSWNVNWLGNLSKTGKVKELVRRVDLNIVLFQETKLGEVDRFLMHSVWDNRFKEWECLPSIGLLGGLLVVRYTRVASKVFVLVGCFSLSVLLDFEGRGCWWVSLDYGPMNLRLRNFFWEDLSFVQGFSNPHWRVGGF